MRGKHIKTVKYIVCHVLMGGRDEYNDAKHVKRPLLPLTRYRRHNVLTTSCLYALIGGCVAADDNAAGACCRG